MTFYGNTEYFFATSGQFRELFYLAGMKLEATEIRHKKSPAYTTVLLHIMWYIGLMELSILKNYFFILPLHAPHDSLLPRREYIAEYRGKDYRVVGSNK